MKLKNIKFMVFTILLTYISCFIGTKVYAKTITPDEVEAPAYVIGSHVFTRNVNETTGYDGKLTTSLIMLASKTIEKDDLDSMIIYYKTSSGKWINGLNGLIVNPPETFEINYTDMQKEVLLGDINDDGVINSKDILRIRKYLIDKNTEISKENSDLNQDGEIDDVDFSILMKYTVDKIKLPYNSGNKYKITYDLDGGVNSDGNLKIYAKISLPLELKIPQKEGYVFLGWTGSNGEVPQKEVTISEDTTGNLNYKANWALLGDANDDGKIDNKDVSRIIKYLNDSDTEISKESSDLNQDGEIDDVDLKILLKYNVDKEGYEITLPYNSGNKYKISYNLDGGVNSDSNIKVYAKISLPFKLKIPQKEGYVFLGWTGSNGNVPQKEVTISEDTTGNLNYKANWALLGDVNGDGKITLKDSTILSKYINNQDVKIIKENSDLNQDGEIDDVDLLILRKYIVDEEDYEIKLPYNSGNKYKISYDLDGGVNSDSNIKVYAKISLPFELKIPQKEGYVFLGWTGSNGEVPQKEVTISQDTAGDLNYKANWSQLNK